MLTIDDDESQDSLSLYEEDISPEDLPFSNLVLVLGILSVLIPLVGFFLGMAAIILHRNNKDPHIFQPEKYGNSYRRSQTGLVFGIIGMGLAFITLLVYYVFRSWWFVWVFYFIFS